MLSLYCLQQLKAYHNLHINDSVVTHTLLLEALWLCSKVYHSTLHNSLKSWSHHQKLYVIVFFIFYHGKRSLINTFHQIYKEGCANVASLWESCLTICFRCSWLHFLKCSFQLYWFIWLEHLTSHSNIDFLHFNFIHCNNFMCYGL